MQVTRFIYADKAKGVKCLLFLPQYIEQKISKFNVTSIRIKERKHVSKRLVEVIHHFKTGLNTMFSPVFALNGIRSTLTKVKYVKNAIFENNFEQF